MFKHGSESSLQVELQPPDESKADFQGPCVVIVCDIFSVFVALKYIYWTDWLVLPGSKISWDLWPCHVFKKKVINKFYT